MRTMEDVTEVNPVNYLHHLVEFDNNDRRDCGIVTQGYRDNQGLHFTLRTPVGSARKFIPFYSIGMARIRDDGSTEFGFNDGETLVIHPPPVDGSAHAA